MLAEFYIHRLSNYMKFAVQKNPLGREIVHRSLGPSKKRRLFFCKELQQKYFAFIFKE